VYIQVRGRAQLMCHALRIFWLQSVHGAKVWAVSLSRFSTPIPGVAEVKAGTRHVNRRRSFQSSENANSYSASSQLRHC